MDELSGANHLFYGVVGAIDGWLACTEKPKGVLHPTDYFSGHYHRFGLNIQAIADANLRFIYFAVAGTGRSNDARVFNRCFQLRGWIESLPDGFFLIGDNAYTLSDKMLIPFSGSAKFLTYIRSYNFYLLQLRIRVEMAFGRLTTKFRIFRRNLDFKLDKTKVILNVAAKIHNFVIDNDNISFNGTATEACDFEVLPLEANPKGPLPKYNQGFLNILPVREEKFDHGSQRAAIVEEIRSMDLQRPIHNLIRNQELDDVSVYEEEE